MTQIVCPCCSGTGTVEGGPPVYLSPMQARIYNAVKHAAQGISVKSLINKVYVDDEDGGPLFADNSIRVQIGLLNKRLAAANVKIGTRRGRLYRIIPL